jgi:hypothetical protein
MEFWLIWRMLRQISQLLFANAFVSSGVNSRAELVTSPRAYARNGAARRWLGDKNMELTR